MTWPHSQLPCHALDKCWKSSRRTSSGPGWRWSRANPRASCQSSSCTSERNPYQQCRRSQWRALDAGTMPTSESIDMSLLPGRLKLWCLQFGLLPRLMWPLTTYEVPTSKVVKLERLLSSFAKNWLGLPRCFGSMGLYGRGILELPVSSLTEEFKCSKVRLDMTLTESRDPCVAQTAPTLATRGKWTPSAATQQAKADLRHCNIVGLVQQVRGGFGLEESRPTWHKAAPSQRRGLVVEEVRRQEQATRHPSMPYLHHPILYLPKVLSVKVQSHWRPWPEQHLTLVSWEEHKTGS